MQQVIESSSLPTSSRAVTRQRASTIFWLMWGMNFLNYLDRFALSGASPLIKKDFSVGDTEIGLLASAFLVTYTIGILPLGLLADRVKRKFVIAGGVSFWSLITILSGLSPNFPALFATRAALGIGEASYFPAGTALLTSCYDKAKRASIMSRWNTGLLAGSAIGVALGGILAEKIGWRPVFFLFGIPGIILASIILRVSEPPRNAIDEADIPELSLARRGLSGIWRDIIDLARIRTIRITVLVQALGFFVIGGSITFLNIFLYERLKISAGTSSTLSGAVLVVGGVAGLLIGSTASNTLIKRFPGARVLVSGWGFLLAAPFFGLSVCTILMTDGLPTSMRISLFLPAFLLAVICLNIYSGPLTAVVQDVTAPAQRATAIGLTLMLSHLLGDLYSPTLIGGISDILKSGSLVTSADALGIALLVTCVPVLLLSGTIGIIGAKAVKHDEVHV
jgi:MFS transporter, Spinster family, sphingosine-1-phosphate transporter